MCQHIHAPALLGGYPRFQPQTGGIVHIPANDQRIFSIFVSCRGKANGNVIDQNPIKHTQQRLQGGLLALKTAA
jgi:hypothetical protein